MDPSTDGQGRIAIEVAWSSILVVVVVFVQDICGVLCLSSSKLVVGAFCACMNSFLKNLFTNDQKCDRSYDQLRIDTR